MECFQEGMGRQEWKITKIDISAEEFLPKGSRKRRPLLEEDMGLRVFSKIRSYYSVLDADTNSIIK